MSAVDEKKGGIGLSLKMLCIFSFFPPVSFGLVYFCASLCHAQQYKPTIN